MSDVKSIEKYEKMDQLPKFFWAKAPDGPVMSSAKNGSVKLLPHVSSFFQVLGGSRYVVL